MENGHLMKGNFNLLQFSRHSKNRKSTLRICNVLLQKKILVNSDLNVATTAKSA